MFIAIFFLNLSLALWFIQLLRWYDDVYYPWSFVFALSLSSLSLSSFIFSLCVYVCLHTQLKVFHSRLLFELQQEYYQHLLPTTSLRINNEQRRFSSFDAFSLLFYFFILCVCVCTCKENNKMMILMTFGLLFCCNRTSCVSLSIFFIFCFILIDALPCVYVCGCIMHSFIFPIFYALSLYLSSRFSHHPVW